MGHTLLQEAHGRGKVGEQGPGTVYSPRSPKEVRGHTRVHRGWRSPRPVLDCPTCPYRPSLGFHRRSRPVPHPPDYNFSPGRLDSSVLTHEKPGPPVQGLTLSTMDLSPNPRTTHWSTSSDRERPGIRGEGVTSVDHIYGMERNDGPRDRRGSDRPIRGSSLQ